MFRKVSEKLSYTQCVPENLSSTHVFLSLGSNLGERKKYLEKALALLQENGFFLLKVSSIYETSPVGCEDGAGVFYNIAVEGIWQKDAFMLLAL
ncbi:MAG: 2-amino-4-hydroxy-6-hydroxymethyldihydropteridine diphosphokinase, partial [Lentisphaeria bacterium]|nr:2-amino-4-hydroxy-6-hydroxymethyldihydropteridine diphosphokinase [Lentisphaeria bacterium]